MLGRQRQDISEVPHLSSHLPLALARLGVQGMGQTAISQRRTRGPWKLGKCGHDLLP